jgi:transcriptional regulator with XRE-family HTH domain
MKGDMNNKLTHWTEKSTADFLFRIGSDFVAQVEAKMESMPMKQTELAEKLGVTKGRVSQIFNNPGNLTLGMIIKCARAVGMKASVVAYDDGDKENKRGPVHSEIFRKCWEISGKPADVWSIRSAQSPCTFVINTGPYWLFDYTPHDARLQARFDLDQGFTSGSLYWERGPEITAVSLRVGDQGAIPWGPLPFQKQPAQP